MTKGVIRNSTSKDRQCNDNKIKDKQVTINTTQKTTDGVSQILLITGMNSEGSSGIMSLAFLDYILVLGSDVRSHSADLLVAILII